MNRSHIFAALAFVAVLATNSFSTGGKWNPKNMAGEDLGLYTDTDDSLRVAGTTLLEGDVKISSPAAWYMNAIQFLGTMTELNALRGGGVLTTLHYHSALSASDGSPSDNFYLGTTGMLNYKIDDAAARLSVYGGSDSPTDYAYRIDTYRMNGSVASPTAATSSDALYGINNYAHDGTGYVLSSQIYSGLYGTIATDRVPSYIGFTTHPNSTSPVAERVRIDTNRTVVWQRSSSLYPALEVSGPTWSMIDLVTTGASASARNWRLAGVYNSYGLFEILHSPSPGTPADVSALAIDSIGVVAINDVTPGGEARRLNVYDNTAASLPVAYVYQDNASATGAALLVKSDGAKALEVTGAASVSGLSTLAGVATGQGSVSASNGSATTLFSVSGGGIGALYDVSAVMSNTSTIYTAMARVVFDGTNARLTADNGASLYLSLSGTNVQATQTSGATQTIWYSYLRIAGQ